MTPMNDRPAPLFVGENSALDFLNSVAAPKTEIIDWLDTEANLLNWLERAGLCQKSETARMADAAMADELTAAHQEIRAFRDAFRAFIAETAGHENVSLDHPMIAQMNETLGRGALKMQITAPGINAPDIEDRSKTTALTTEYELHSPRDLLLRIVAACAKLICEADFRYVRNCEGPTCTIYFLDVSKNHKRRWCSMSICGNRAKAAAHRKTKAGLPKA